MSLFRAMGAATVADLEKSNESLRNDPRTLQVLGKLFLLNKLGCPTFNSQVGVIENDTRQRAFVDCFIHKSAWKHFRRMMSQTEFLVCAQDAEATPTHNVIRPVPLTVEKKGNGELGYYTNTWFAPWPLADAVSQLTPSAKEFANLNWQTSIGDLL